MEVRVEEREGWKREWRREKDGSESGGERRMEVRVEEREGWK